MTNLSRIKKLICSLSSDVIGVKMNINVEYDQHEAYNNQNLEPRIYLQVSYDSPCSKTGDVKTWKARKHYLSDYMTDDEVVKTAYTAVKMAVEHEIMEGFKFDGKLIFNPHTPYTELMKVSDKELVREKLWSKKDLDAFSYGEAFKVGHTVNSPEGLHMTNENIGEPLTWVAMEGYRNDWAMYVEWSKDGIFKIMKVGDKVPSESAKRLLNCDSEMIKYYRP